MDLSKKAKLDALWRRGVVVWFLHDVQRRMMTDIQGSTSKKYVINSSRRLGKSTLLCCLAIERALQFPDQQIKFASETQRSVKKIIHPIFRQILSTCPKDLRPKFHSHDGVYSFANGSEIHIAGAAMEQVDGLRGTACDLALVDEAAFIGSLDYLIDSVLLPQTLNRPNAKIIMASTPPPTPDHPFVTKYMAEAMGSGNYSHYTIYDNPLLSAETIEEFKREAGGEDSTTWRREYLGEIIADDKRSVFPEATDHTLFDKQVYEIKRPPYFIPITSIDLGYNDYTGVLFGYYHFPSAKIVIEDEILINKANSTEIVRLVREKEKALWGDLVPQVRVVDGPALVIADLNETHRFTCRLPEKSDLAANVNRIRIDLAAEVFCIHPKCKQLIAQIQYAIWDTTRTKFARSASSGHFDLAASLLYFCKHVDRRTNPFPASFGYDYANDWGFPRSHVNSSAIVLNTMFPYRRK